MVIIRLDNVIEHMRPLVREEICQRIRSSELTGIKMTVFWSAGSPNTENQAGSTVTQPAPCTVTSVSISPASEQMAIGQPMNLVASFSQTDCTNVTAIQATRLGLGVMIALSVLRFSTALRASPACARS